MLALLTYLQVVHYCKKLGQGYRCGLSRCREMSPGTARLGFVLNCQLFFFF